MSDEVELIYLCDVGAIAGPDEDVEQRLTWLARVLEKLGWLIASDHAHIQLHAMLGQPGTRPGPIYLCTMADLAGPGASEDRVLGRMRLLAGILHKLGWDLASGVEPDFHELWALRPEFPGLGDNGGTPEAGA
jgi:hypothetical protein